MLKAKKVLSFFMTLIMMISMFTVLEMSSFSEDDILSYLTYEIKNGEVTITDCDESVSGDIVIPETIEGYPVRCIGESAFDYITEMTCVTIPDTVTEIGNAAFNGCFELEKINIPRNVEYIGHSVFALCSSLKEIVLDERNAYFSSDEYGVLFNKDKTELVKYPSADSRSEYTIPDTVTVIGDCAFCYAENLININHSCNLEKIEEGAFDECVNLSGFSIPDSIVEIDMAVFAGCKELKEIEIPDTVKRIKSRAFCYCENLESMIIPGSVEIIEIGAFSGCEKLSELIISDGVKRIEEDAFAGCSSLQKVIIPSSVTMIKDRAFGYVSEWGSFVRNDGFIIMGAPGSAAEVYADENGFTFIACSHENLTEYAEIPATCAKVGYTAGIQCNDCSEWISGHQEIQKNLHIDADKDDICDNCPYVINVFDGDILEYLTYEIKDGEVIIIGCDKSIYGSYRLPAEIEGYPVTEIGWQAFMQCSYLSYIEFPDTLRKIGYGAFWNSGLEIVKIPDSVEIIEDDAFGDCFSLKGIYTGRNITEISGQMLRENSSLTDVFIGKKVKKIGYWGFNLSDNIENIYYEGTQEEWKQIVVNGTGNDILETASIIFNCTDDSYAVWQSEKYDSENILKYSISAGKVTIEGVNPDYYGDINIPEYIDGYVVTYIAEIGFVNFPPEIGELTIPKGVEKIYGDFSTQFNRIGKFVVDDENQYYSSIDGNLFNKDKTELLKYATGSNRKEYTIPDSVVTINKSAFSELNSGIFRLNIPYSVTEIEDYAFYDAQSICYITVDENNPSFIADNGVLFSKDKTELICYPAMRSYACYYFNLVPECEGEGEISYYAVPDGVTEIATAAFNHCNNGLATVFLPESVVTIGEDAFAMCGSLKSVDFSGGVTSISSRAFLGTTMEEFVFPDSVEYIGNAVFQANYSLRSVTIPDSVKYIGNSAFIYCENLTDIKMGDNEKNIGIDVFYDTAYYNNTDNWENNALYIGNNLIEVNDSEITEYTVKDGTVNIAGGAFRCPNVRYLNLPDSVASISNYAFAGMSSVEKIDIPSGITEISDYAFSECANLREINIPESVTKIGKGIFFWSDSISQINYDGDKAGWNNIEISDVENDWVSYLTINCKKEPVVDKLTTQEPVESISGDLDGNGKITAADARVALRISVKLEIATEAQKILADVNHDGKITAADARKILRISVRLE